MCLTLQRGCQSAVNSAAPRTIGMAPIGALVCLLALPVDQMTCVPLVHALTMFVPRGRGLETNVTQMVTVSVGNVESSVSLTLQEG